ncbi:hypothetical protein [Maribacter sp. 2304DJ31-5]|uniref:hypothetical protein n=1 Tax=Maribacter sp. 2304DJ31-5 TaxID=3386273 RepID=UPI0039BCED5A
MKFTKKLLGLFIAVSLLMACSAEDGEDGAIGPSGSQGEQGPAGPQGEQGDPGTANVIYSGWIGHGFGNSPVESSAAGFDIEAPEITNAILNNGVILVYGRRLNNVAEEADLTYYLLPYTFYGSLQVEYRYRIEPPTDSSNGVIRVQVRKLDDTDLNADATLISGYRYVIIPGGTEAGGKSSTAVDYSKMSYEEITSLFKIED